MTDLSDHYFKLASVSTFVIHQHQFAILQSRIKTEIDLL